VIEDDLRRHRQAEGAMETLCLAGFTMEPEVPMLAVLHQRRGDASSGTGWPIARVPPFDELEPTDLVELRPFCFGVRNRGSITPDRVADTKLVLLVGFWGRWLL
jgi:hypothetical protein